VNQPDRLFSEAARGERKVYGKLRRCGKTNKGVAIIEVSSQKDSLTTLLNGLFASGDERRAEKTFKMGEVQDGDE